MICPSTIWFMPASHLKMPETKLERDAPWPKGQSWSAVFFDLDGTLADTGPDLARALNAVLTERAAKPLPYDIIRPIVSCGTEALLRLGFGDRIAETTAYPEIRERFLLHYISDIARETRLFPGMAAVLDQLEQKRIPWGIVTNKPEDLTTPLISEMALEGRTAITVCGDTLPFRKPHPAPLLHACKVLGVEPAKTVYIGDAERDIEAGRRAGMWTLIALFGYLTDRDRPETWQASGQVRHAAEISSILGLTE